jgi:hypothetical protein
MDDNRRSGGAGLGPSAQRLRYTWERAPGCPVAHRGGGPDLAPHRPPGARRLPDRARRRAHSTEAFVPRTVSVVG